MTPSLRNTPVASWRTGQAIVLDWYDGPREGLCRMEHPAAELTFILLAERATADDLDERLFSLAFLPSGTVANVLRALAFAGAPSAPVWVPLWHSPVSEELARANEVVAAAMQSAVATDLVVATADFVRFEALWEVPRPHTTRDWFAFLEGRHR
jgi:hypothetical protein